MMLLITLYRFIILVCNKMTTYDYIVQNRNNATASKASLPSDVESAGEPAPPPMRPLSVHTLQRLY